MTEAMKRRLLGVVALLVVGGALGWVSMSDMGDELVYYWSPTELAAAPNAHNALVRLGGMVVPGTVEWDKDAAELSFDVTDGEQTMRVHSDGNPPQMFREGIGVVVEGRLQDDGVFHTNRVMVKHSNEYEAPDDEGGHVNPYKSLATEGT